MGGSRDVTSRRITRSSTRASLEKTKFDEVGEVSKPNPKARFPKCSPVIPSEPADVYEFEADPNEPRAFKKKRHYSRKPQSRASRAKKPVTASPTRIINTRSSQKNTGKADMNIDVENMEHKTATKSSTNRADSTATLQAVWTERPTTCQSSADTACSSSLGLVADATAGMSSVLQDIDLNAANESSFSGPAPAEDFLMEMPEENLFAEPETRTFINPISTPKWNGASSPFPDADLNFSMMQQDQPKTQSTPLRSTSLKDHSLRVPFSPINRDHSIRHSPSRPAAENYSKTARLDGFDMKKLCSVKENLKTKSKEKNISLLIDCAAETEGVNSPIKASDDNTVLKPPPSPQVHFSRPARRSYSSRTKAQRQLLQEDDSESEEEATERRKKTKANKKTAKNKDPQYDRWVDQMKHHFDDIENYTLVCD